ncbi:MAG: sterol desaturase/sphingolipid hydroxylase (fatty acid hydroxylase superfamily) [Polaribacter sp.]|jgi:sterol desaturase/sphingolipid hydroxylase (fatty acid hydroxylase superfamily)
MDSFIDYFAHMPTLHRSIVLVGGLTIFFLIENAAPLFALTYNRKKHTWTNVFFTLTTVLVNLGMAFVLVSSADWVEANSFGLIQWINMPLAAEAIIGLLLMDLMGAYLPHWVLHHVKWMWKFHLIHHTDQHLDTTSANRHHPGESVIRFVFTLVAVFIVGAPMWLVFFYQSMSLVLTQFNHANINMPKWLDNSLLLLLCTPNMHRVHHHYRQPYSDSNYGNIFPFWDKLFGTYLVIDNKKLVYGVDTHMDVKEVNEISNLLKIPFQPYRPPIKYDTEEKL